MPVVLYKDYNDLVNKRNEHHDLSWPDEAPRHKWGDHTGGYLLVSENSYKSKFYVPLFSLISNELTNPDFKTWAKKMTAADKFKAKIYKSKGI